MTFARWGVKGRLLAPQERAVCATEQKLELNSGSVAGATGKGRLCNGAEAGAKQWECCWERKEMRCYVGIPTYIYTSVVSVWVILKRSLYSVKCFQYCSILREMNGILPIRGNLLCCIMLSVVTCIESKFISFIESGIKESTQHHIYYALHKHVSPKPLWWSFLHNVWFVHSVFIFL
jgi:hypothetical protein